jgi:hypothetical protein
MNLAQDPEMLRPLHERFEKILAKPISEGLSFAETLPSGVERTDRWTWSDALYVPPDDRPPRAGNRRRTISEVSSGVRH